MLKRIFFLLFLPFMVLNAQQVKDIIEKSDVLWNSPSKKSIESMILGNGDIGTNIWAEKSGDIYIYVGKTDSWDEYSRLAKVGLVKIHIIPNPFEEKFSQRLDLYNGQILIESGKNDNLLKIKIWVDANNPVINLEYESDKEYTYVVSPVIWRNKIREITGEENHSLYGFASSKHALYIYPDSVLEGMNDKLVWFHRNKKSIWKETEQRQGMSSWAENHDDPLLGNTFGCLAKGSSLTAYTKTALKSSSEKSGVIRIFSLTKRCNNLIEWLSSINDISKMYEKKKENEYYKEHIKYWNQFWDKSYIHLYGNEDAEKLSKMYTLQRFVTASAGRGKYPIKFNGSVFTVDSCDSLKNFDADYRMWGGAYWHQNTRLIYWPLLSSGDFDLMKPFFNLYFDNLNYAKAKAKALFNHEGAFYPETFYFWGSYTMDNFGWDTEAKNFKYTENQYIRYHYQGALETLAMMLDYFEFTRDIKFAEEDMLPFAREILTFYEKHFHPDKNGKLYIFPSQALETYWDVANPTPDVAGLRWNLTKLISLPKNVLDQNSRNDFKRLLKSIPEIPTGTVNSKKVILPCEKIPEKISNSENPELYAVFPYRFYGIDKPGYETAVNTFSESKFRYARCWQQMDVAAAYLGLPDSASMYLLHRMDYVHPEARFPVFWSGNMDWCPDEDHGGNLMIALQAMLLQYDDKQITLLPSLPKNWNVDFKLNAPDKTVISCNYKNGKIESLEVTPKSRKKDIKIK